MTFSLGGSDELTALAQAIGLLDAQANLDIDWFSQPLTKLEGIVGSAPQRAALGRFCDLALPPVTEPGRPDGEKWHPLLGGGTGGSGGVGGDLSLTLRDTGSGLVIGIGGEFHSGPAAAVPGRLRVQADVISAGSSADFVLAGVANPISVEVRVETGWTAGPSHPVGLGAIVGRATLTLADPDHPAFGLQVVLEQLSLHGEPPVDKVLSVDELGRDAPGVLSALLKVVLAETGADATVQMVADHLMGLLGLDGTGPVPAFPFAELGEGPAALQQWLTALTASGGVGMTAFLQHLAGLLGQTATVTGTGTAADPWRIPILHGPVGQLAATAALVGVPADRHLRIGIAISAGAALTAPDPRLNVEAAASIADIPLTGSGHAVVLPQATVMLRVTGNSGPPLVDDAGVRIGTFQAGVAWDGSHLAPTLQLLDNTFAGTPYPVLDLTNADSVEAAAASVVVNAITDALGTGVGRRLAALVGLVPPEDPANPGQPLPGWAHHLDLATLVVNPPAAIGAYHRGVILDGTQWSYMLREIAQLAGLTDAVAGSGTSDQPWTVAVATVGAATLHLAGWHQPDPAAPTTEQVRVGLRLAAGAVGATVALTSEALTFDLPATGPAHVGFLGAQRLALEITPAVDGAIGPIGLSLQALTIGAGWQPGHPFAWGIRATGLSVGSDGDSVTVADLHFPPPTGFDLTDLATTAAGLGLTVTDLEQLFRLVLAMLAHLAGPTGDLTASLLGLSHRLPGLATDAPTLVDPAQPGLLFRDPLGALRGWLVRLLAHVGADGRSSAEMILQYLASLGTDLLDRLLSDVRTELTPGLPDFLLGGGTFQDPWRMPWPGGGKTADGDGHGPDLEVWLEPAGPPASWLGGLKTRAQDAVEMDDLAQVLLDTAAYDPSIGSLVRGLTVGDLASRLRTLQTQLNNGDGVVSRDSQGPDIFGWVLAAEVDAAHLQTPHHPDAISAVLEWIETLRGSGTRTVLLVGPGFADRTLWDDLLASPSRQGPTDPNAYIDLRTPGIDPRTIALDNLTAVADYYVADLADDGGGDVAYLADQIAHIADRLNTLHPGPLTIVAHSYAGLAARRFAKDHADRMQGLITVGTPHLGEPLDFLTDIEAGDAIRLAAALRPGLAASPVRDALDHLLGALEGYRPPATPSALATPNPYPVRSFALAAPFDLGDVPVVAVTGTLTDDVFATLQAGLVAYLDTLIAAPHADPTHLSYGMSMPMSLGTPAFGTPQAEGRVRFGLGQIALAASPPAPPRPPRLLRAELELFRGTGWLVGGPGLGDPDLPAVDGRARRVRVGITAQQGASGIAAVLDATADQAAWRGTTVTAADLADPRAAALIGAGFGAVLAATDDTANQFSTLATVLAPLDLLSTDAEGITGLSGDGFAALRTDPVGYLRTRIPTALAQPAGWAGLVTDPSAQDGYLWLPPDSPYGLFARRQPDGTWRTGIGTTTDPEGVLSIGADINLLLPAFQADAELFLNLGPVTLHYRADAGTVALDADKIVPGLDGIVLWPTPPIAQLAADLDSALPTVLATAAISAVLSRFAPNLQVTDLHQLLHNPGDFLTGPAALGLAGGGLDPAKLAGLLATLNSALGLPAGPGLQLPADLSITAGPGASAGAARVSVATASPIGGILGIGFTLDIDAARHVTPGGTVSLSTPLAGTWPHVEIAFGASPAGLSLVVTPQGVPPITLLPTFSGLGALRGAAEALLPSVLDAAINTYPDPKPTWLAHLLAAAGHLDLYDPAGKFSAHASSFTAMLEGTWFATFDAAKQSEVATAIVDILTLIPGLPPAVTSSGGLVQWTVTLPGGIGAVEVAAGWGAHGPTVQAGISNLRPAAAPLEFSAHASIDSTGVDVGTALGLDLSGLGVTAVPKLLVDLQTGPPVRFRVRLAPTASAGDDGPLILTLAPAFQLAAGADTAADVLTGWALPLAVSVAVSAAQPMLARPLWTGGPTLQTALTDAGILTGGGAVAHPLPTVFQMLAGFLAEAAGLLDQALGDLHIRLVDESQHIGLALSGHQDVTLGDLTLSVVFGAPAAWGAAAAEGLKILLIDTSGPDPAFAFGLELHGVGIALAKSDGTALVAETFLRLGSVRALLFLDLESDDTGFHVLHGGAGLELGGFGLPIGAALGGGGDSNPVASNLLSSGGSGGSAGDQQSVNPTSDIDVWYWDSPANPDGPLRVLVGGQAGVFWIPIHAGFGPIFIDQIGLGVTNTAMSLAIDGGVSVAGLTAQVDDLSVTVPYAHVTDPGKWTLDLRGLAVGYSNPALTIAGGLVKFDGPPVEYDGMLLVKVGTIGVVVIGAYSVVPDGDDQYTSFAIFGGVFVPIGIPPLINLTGLALGLGYNRRLIVPEDLNKIPDFMLVKALDNPEALANDPMQALFEFRQQTPAARGALWLAVGLRGTSFQVVNLTAVLYASLDNGIEIGILGVARMALPTSDAAIVSIELALKARFSSAEALFSIQAQLTDNSWLITRDCQLTGGFAYFMWFRKSQFLLTLGGYHPAFKPLPEYPVVPRLGFRWDFLGVVHIKGEAYFALTNSAVMAGTRLEASYGPDWLQLWFDAYLDILVSWDPFHYEFDVGVSVGARLRIEICFFACCHIEISISVGASLHLVGPPFHGTVTVDLGVCSITVPFGDDALPKPPAKHWDEFVATYIRTGDDNALPVGAQVSNGLMPPEPAGAPVAPGTADQPWRLAAEWTLRTETRMPVRGFALQLDDAQPESQMDTVVFGRFDNLSATYAFDIAPMYVSHASLATVHRVVLSMKPVNGTDFIDLVPRSQNPADVTLEIDERLFRVTPIIGQVSEAAYHYFPDLKPPAAANTLPVLTGLVLDGIAGLHNASQVIPIGTLVDASNYRPLPFARRDSTLIGAVLQAGAAWQVLAATADGVTTAKLLGAVSAIVGGSGDFVALRTDSGLRPSGYGPVARTALTGRRSAPPVLSALSEGFTLQAPGQGTAPPPVRVGPVAPVPLTAPRLRAVVQRPIVSAAGHPSVRTTVPSAVLGKGPDGRPIPVVNVRDDLVTSFDAPGFALLTRAAAGTPQPTRAARSARTLRHPAQGAATGRAAGAALEQLAKQAVGDGVTVRAGATQIWELPPRAGWRLGISGDSAVRVTELSRSGTVITDSEAPAGPRTLTLDPRTAQLAITALGVPSWPVSAVPRAAGHAIGTVAAPTAGRGAVTGAASAAAARPVLGWQLGTDVVQVGPTTLLARGAVLRLSAPTGAPVRGQVAATGAIQVSRALLDQQVVQTDFPSAGTVIGVLVDSTTSRRLGPDSVVVHTAGGAVTGLPTQVQAGNRTLFLYDVTRDVAGQRGAGDPGPGELSVTVGLVAPRPDEPLLLAGAVASTGTAAAWAAALDGSTLTRIVADEHLTPNGTLVVRLTPVEENHG